MVKLYSLAVLHRSEQGSPQLLKAAYDLSSFGFFQRGSVQEFMAFTAKILTERTAAASRQSVKQGGMYMWLLNGGWKKLITNLFLIWFQSICVTSMWGVMACVAFWQLIMNTRRELLTPCWLKYDLQELLEFDWLTVILFLAIGTWWFCCTSGIITLVRRECCLCSLLWFRSFFGKVPKSPWSWCPD